MSSAASYERGTRRSRGRRQPSYEQSVTRRVNELTLGQSYRPPLIPPLFSSQPWNNVTVRYLTTIPAAKVDVSAGEIADFLCLQVGAYTGSSSNVTHVTIELRIQSVAVWLLVEKRACLKLMPMDFLRGSKYCELANVDSMAQKNMYAAAGFHYPVSHRSHVFVIDNKNENDGKVPIFSLDGTPGDVECHVRCLWRGANTGNLTQTFQLEPVAPRSKPKKDEVPGPSSILSDEILGTDFERLSQDLS